MPDVMTREAIAAVYAQGVEAVIALVEDLRGQVTALSARVEEMERQRRLDSHNSSKPPSTDQPGSRLKPKSPRQRSGKKAGGQPGHHGQCLMLRETADRIVVDRPERCRACGASLADARVVAVERRQVIDLVPVLTEVVEHQVESRQCRCGETSCGHFPLGVDTVVQYGPGVRALTVYLNQQHLIPVERTAAILADVFGCSSLSDGTVENAVATCFDKLEAVEAAIKAGVQQAAVAHFDETGLNVNGATVWVHVASTATLTHYGWQRQRGAAAANRIGILPAFQGKGVHDGLESYWSYPWTHALCNAHHLRELTFLEEELHQAWAGDMKALLCAIKQAVDTARSAGATRVPPDRVQQFETRYAQLLATGFAGNPPPVRPAGTRGRPKRGKVLGLLDRLRNHQDAVLAFMHDFAVPFDNNQAERDLRMVKVQQKVSGCFRKPCGADRFCRIRGYLSTARKQGHNAFAWLQSVFLGHPIMPAISAG